MTNTSGVSGTGPVDRRTVLRAAGLSTGAALVTGVAAPGGAAAQPPGAPAPEVFAHGVASGDPLPDRVLLWTRVTPTVDAEPGSGAGPDVQVTWQVATDPELTEIVAEGVFDTGPARDHTVKVDVTGLSPGTGYWYRFGYDGAHSQVGRTSTAPGPDDDVTALRAGVVSCSNWEAGYFSAYRHLAARGDLDLVLHLGDYIYEYATGSFAAAGRVVRRHEPSTELLSLADYRIRHAQYKSDPDLRALHAAAPWVITWDDHEVANNTWAQGAQNHSEGSEGTYTERFAAAARAYDEWMPVRLDAGGRLYRRLRFGRLAELSMLDLRTYRTRPGSANDNLDDPSRSITGVEQMTWLRTGLSTTDARWKLVGNPMMVAPLDISTVPSQAASPLRLYLGLPVEHWDGYRADRDGLLAHLRDTGTTDVVFLTGDVHMSFANELRGGAPGTATPAAAEFIVPSVTSDNGDDYIRSVDLSAQAHQAITAANDHIRWADLDRHGYGVLDLTAARCRMDWYFLADRTDAESDAAWGAAWSVTAGSATLQQESDPPA